MIYEQKNSRNAVYVYAITFLDPFQIEASFLRVNFI